MKLKIILILFLFFQFVYLYSARIKAELNSGGSIAGEALKEDEESMTIVSDDLKSTNTVRKTDIRELYYIHYRLAKNYPVLGTTFGSPAGINLNVGYHFGSFGVQLSGGYLGTIAGVQLNVLWKFYEDEYVTHALSLMSGYSTITVDANRSEWLYLGPAYNLNWGLFYLEAGLSFGTGSYTNPQFFAQIGILHRFNSEKL